jgi:hypothetical protein
MHHLTTQNLPTLSSKEADRQWLAAALAEAEGIQVTTHPIEPRPASSGPWTSAPIHTTAQKAGKKTGRPTGSTADDSALVERATAMAKLGLSRYATARNLKIGCDRLDRIIARHNITFITKAA